MTASGMNNKTRELEN
jgi:restriction endonuclease S subunit